MTTASHTTRWPFGNRITPRSLSAAVSIIAVLASAPAIAQDVTWLAGPPSNDYNSDLNWLPNAAPVNQGDTAIFGQSNTTNLTITAPADVDAWIFNAGADGYVFTNDQALNFLGDGITVTDAVNGVPFAVQRITNDAGGTVAFYFDSGAGHIFIDNNDSVLFSHNSSADSARIENNANIVFGYLATAANSQIQNNLGGSLEFQGLSTAGNADITNDATTDFRHNSTAANATVTNSGDMTFWDDSTAGDAQITNTGASAVLWFDDSSTAGDATIINEASSLAIFFDDFSSAGSANITNDGEILFQNNSTADNAAILNGNGADLQFFQDSAAANATITNAAGGEVYFADNSTAGGATIGNEGQIRFVDASTAGTATITNDVLAAETLFFGNSSAGNATLDNNGLLGFAGDSTAADATITNSGTIQWIDNSSAGNATITNDGLIQLSGTASLGNARLINAAGATADISALLGVFGTIVGSIEGNGDIILGDRGLITGSNDLSTEFSGVLSGAGGALGKIGEGTLTLSGVSTYTGETQIVNGALIVDGSIASSSMVTVNAGAVLGGNGAVGTTIVGSEGTIAPGNSIGMLSVAGDITFSPDSIFEVEINSLGQSDHVDATGIATLNGGSVEIVPLPDYAIDTQYIILTAAGGVGGSFDGVDFADPSLFLTPTLAYDPNNVFVTIAQTADFDSAALTPNQFAAAGGAQSLGGGDLFNAIALLGAEDEARSAFDAISGEIHASAKTAVIEDSRFVRDAAAARLGVAGENLGFWTQTFGASGHIDSDGNAAALDRSVGGIFIGADGEVFDGWRAGALAGYSHSSFGADDRASSGLANSYHLGAYGGTEWNDFTARFGGAYSWHDIAVSRAVAFTGFSDSLSSSYSAGTGQIFGEVSYGVDVDSARFEPFANVAWVNHATTGFTEDGGAAALDSASDVVNSTFATLGLRASTELVVDEASRARLSGAIGWRHAFGDTTTATNTFVAGGDAFGVAGVPLSRDALVLEASFDMDISPDATLGFAYSGQLASGVSDHSIKANFGVRF